jgi:hypothetical protein
LALGAQVESIRYDADTMSNSIVAEGLDVDELGHVVVKLNDTPSEDWTAAFREYWGSSDAVGTTAIKRDAFSHISGRTIVFRGVDVAGFVAQCKRWTEDSIKSANELMRRIETERDERIRARTEAAGHDKKVDAEKAKARQVKFN